jgi:hypothetical protein
MAALRLLLAPLMFLLAVEPVFAQNVTFSGQVRPRWEVRDPAPPGGRDAFIVMRSRLGAAVALPDNLAIFLQIQDVRFWGDDRVAAPGAPLAVTELHQAYLDIDRLAGPNLVARIGRQEIALGSERLVGRADWTPRGRAFDAGRATWGAQRSALDLVAARIADRSAGRAADVIFAGVHATMPVTADGTGSAFLFYDGARGPARTDQATLGARLMLRPRTFSFEIEGAVQAGERADADVSAWMLRAHAGPRFDRGRGRLLLAFEHYSGGDPASIDVRAFDALYGTGHIFLGYADLFTNLPVHTAGRGVQDIGIRAGYAPRAGSELIVNVHAFRVPFDDGLDSARFGEELDVRVVHRLRAPLGLVAGWSHVWQGPALAGIGRLQRDMDFLYVMLNATF